MADDPEHVLRRELARVHGRRVDVWRVGPAHALVRALPSEIALYEIDRALAVLSEQDDGSARESAHELTVGLETAGAFVAILDQLGWDSPWASHRAPEPATESIELEARFRALLPPGVTHVSMVRRGQAWVSWADGRLALYDAALAVDHADGSSGRRGDAGDLERFEVATADTFPWASLIR